MSGGSYGDAMRAVRVSRHLTQRDLAEVSGVYFTTVFNAERNVSQPCVQTLNRLAKALGVTIDQYIGRPVNDSPMPWIPGYESMNTAQRLKAVRISRGMHVKDLAVESGVPQPTIYSYESGRSEIGAFNAECICDVLNIRIDALYN